MIDLGRAPLHAFGVTVFCDHADATRFHYVSDAPRLRTTDAGTPELSLLKYQLDPTLHQALGGGLLSLTVDLSVPDDVLKRLAGRLAQQYSLPKPAQLSPVVVEDGNVDVVVVDKPSDTGLVQRVLGGGAPSLYGGEACTVMAVLAADGVGLVEQALRAGGLPVGVIYRLSVLGLRPAIRARITAKWQDIYHYYENKLHGGKLLFAVDVGETLEDLVHAEAITVVVDQLVPPDQQDQTYQRALDQVQRYIVDQFFKPTLGQQPPPPDSSTGPLATIGNAIKDIAGFFGVTYSLVDVNRDELKTMTYELAAAQAERLTLSPQGTFSALAQSADGAPLDADRFIRTVSATASDEMDFDIGPAIDFAAEQIDHVDVMLAYGTHNADILLDGTARKSVSFFRESALGPSIAYHYEVDFKPGAATLGHLQSPPVQTDSRVLRINPRELYERIAVTAIAQGVPFDRYPQVIVDVRVPHADGSMIANTIQLDADHTEAGFTLLAPLGAKLPLQRRVRYVDAKGVETVVDWDTVPAGILIVGDPCPDVLTVQVLGSARFGTDVSRIVVELRPAARPDQVATAILTLAQPSASWSFARAANADPAYQYRVTIQTTRGEVRQGQWLTADGGTLVVGESIARLRQVTLMFVGKSLRDLGLLGIKVRFGYDDDASNLHAEDEVMVQDASKPVSWSYPIADVTRLAYTYQLTMIHSDGQVEPRDPVSAADLLLVVPLT